MQPQDQDIPTSSLQGLWEVANRDSGEIGAGRSARLLDWAKQVEEVQRQLKVLAGTLGEMEQQLVVQAGTLGEMKQQQGVQAGTLGEMKQQQGVQAGTLGELKQQQGVQAGTLGELKQQLVVQAGILGEMKQQQPSQWRGWYSSWRGWRLNSAHDSTQALLKTVLAEVEKKVTLATYLGLLDPKVMFQFEVQGSMCVCGAFDVAVIWGLPPPLLLGG